MMPVALFLVVVLPWIDWLFTSIDAFWDSVDEVLDRMAEEIDG